VDPENTVMIPDQLRRSASADPAGVTWLEQLPDLCARLCDAWNLRIGRPYPHCHVALVLAAETEDDRAVLKIPMPAEVRLGTLLGDVRGGEPSALRAWAGQGAVRLLAHDDATNAILLEQCRPGHTLDQLPPQDGDAAAVDVMQRLRLAAGPDDLPRLVDRARDVAEGLPGRWERLQQPFEPWLLALAVDLLRQLAADDATATATAVMLHGDFHPHNILSTERGWLAIDPLPVLGDPAYDAVQYLLFRQGDLAEPQAEWGGVIDRICALLEIDPERTKAWIFARLVSDAVASIERGSSVPELDTDGGDLWAARLVHRLRG
jgi:streptomycin 6-kinase